MDIVVLFFITLLIYLLPMNDDYLSVQSTTGLKGLLAFGIIFHHLSQWITSGTEFSHFSYMGTYIVSIFFFLSGYGLYFQNEKKKNYMDGFLYKRLTKILIPFLFISFIYLVYRVLNGQIINVTFFLDLFQYGSTVIFNGWFVNIIILMYLFFYVSFKFSKNTLVSILINTLLIFVYIIIAMKLKYGFWWYNSSFPFALGLLWRKYQEKIDELINNHYFVFLVILSILLFISHQYDYVLSKLHIFDSYSYTLAANLDNVIFTLYFLLFMKKIDFSNRYLIFFGGISFELYMIHGLLISFFGKFFVSSKVNDVFYTVLVIVFSVLLAILIHKFLKYIQRFIP